MVELLSSGETGLIRNESLRHALIRFDQSLQQYQVFNIKLNSAYLAYNLRLNDLAWPEFTLSGTDRTVAGVKGVHYDLATMRADPKLLPSLTALLGFYSDQVREMRGISKRANALEKRLEATQ